MSEPRIRVPRIRGRRGLAVLGVGVGVAVVAALLGFGLTREPGNVRSPLLGRPAPEFTLRTLDGEETISLSDLRGRVVVINFWASWCLECKIEHPHLEAAWSRFRDRGVVFLGIPFQDLPAKSREYAEATGGGWPMLEDPGSRTGIAYGVFGVPETYFIGPDGRIASKHVGPVTYDLLSERITALLREEAAA